VGARVGVSGRTMDKVRKIQKCATDEEKEKLIGEKIRIDKVYKIIMKRERREDEAKERKRKSKEFDKLPSGVEAVKFGRFQEMTKEYSNNYFDAIVTDPPYGENYFQDWCDLASVAERILKPSGFLILYASSANLDKMIIALSEHLIYYYCFVLFHASGQRAKIDKQKIFCWTKPILVYQKKPFRAGKEYIPDYIEGSGREKELHDWQQSADELKIFVENFTEPNDLILDPFAGTGTTALACLSMKRRIILIDDTEENIEIIRGGLKEFEERK